MNRVIDLVVICFEAIYKIAGFYFGYWILVELYKVTTSILYSNIITNFKIFIIFVSVFLGISCIFYLYKAYKTISRLIEAYWIRRIFPEIIKLGNFAYEIKNNFLLSLTKKYFEFGGQENEEWLHLREVSNELFEELEELFDSINIDKASFKIYCEIGFIIYYDFLHWNQMFLKKPVFELSLDEILDNTKESDCCIFGIMKKMQKMIMELQVIENV